MRKMFIGNLSEDTGENEVQDLFAAFGTVRSLKLATDVFSGRCRGFGFVEMEGHEARAAMAGLDGKLFKGRPLRVRAEQEGGKGGRGRRHGRR
jgi:RNA recognition motif-containing protein